MASATDSRRCLDSSTCRAPCARASPVRYAREAGEQDGVAGLNFVLSTALADSIARARMRSAAAAGQASCCLTFQIK